MDTLTQDERSRLMARVKSKNTKPERVIRSMLHRLGFRFRLHRRDLPGTPDIVLPRHRTAIQVRGCFWHGHSKPGCPGARIPKSRVEFWTTKIQGNAERDKRSDAALRKAGWRVVVLWECELKNLARLERRLLRVLEKSA